eukprot:UN31899
MPQLMWRCIKQELYEEAISVRRYAINLVRRHPDIKILQQLVKSVNNTSEKLERLLLKRLEENIQLPECLRIVGHLRNMGTKDDNTLRSIFLEKRLKSLEKIIANLQRTKEHDPYGYLTEFLASNRTKLFEMITQYRSIFVDETDNQEGESFFQMNSLHTWTYKRIQTIIDTLERFLPRMTSGSQLNHLVEDCLVCGVSLGKAGADFRGLIIPNR